MTLNSFYGQNEFLYQQSLCLFFTGEPQFTTDSVKQVRERLEMNLPLAQGIGPDTWTRFTALWTN